MHVYKNNKKYYFQWDIIINPFSSSFHLLSFHTLILRRSLKKKKKKKKKKNENKKQQQPHLPRDPADVNVSEKHVWSLLLHKTFYRSKTLEKLIQKFFLPVPIMARKSTLPAKVWKTPLQGQRLTSSLLCTLLNMTSVFMTAPGCLFVRPSHCGRHLGKINGLKSTYVKVWRCTFWRITVFLTKKPWVELFECEAEVSGWLNKA